MTTDVVFFFVEKQTFNPILILVFSFFRTFAFDVEQQSKRWDLFKIYLQIFRVFGRKGGLGLLFVFSEVLEYINKT